MNCLLSAPAAKLDRLGGILQAIYASPGSDVELRKIPPRGLPPRAMTDVEDMDLTLSLEDSVDDAIDVRLATIE